MLGNGLLVVKYNVFSGNIVYKLIVLAVEVVYLHSGLNISPQGIVNVYVFVNRLEHTVDNALGESRSVAGEEIDSFAAQNVCGKVGVTAVPCGSVILYLAAVLALEKVKGNGFGVSAARRIDVIVSKPFDGLVFQLNVTEILSRNLLDCFLVFLSQSSGVYLNGNLSGGLSGSCSGFLSGIRAAAAACKTKCHSKCGNTSNSSLEVFHFKHILSDYDTVLPDNRIRLIPTILPQIAHFVNYNQPSA